MSGVNSIPGRITPSHISGSDPMFDRVAYVIPESGPVGAAARINGAYIAEELSFNPNQSDTWEILGFSVQVRIAYTFGDNIISGARWARFGDLWAGILKDLSPPRRLLQALPIWPPAEFPNNLSTFVEIWSGSEDNIADVSSVLSAGVPNDRTPNYTLLARSTVLPFPLRVQPGSQLAFAIIMTPSVVAYGCQFQIASVDYSVNYNTIR